MKPESAVSTGFLKIPNSALASPHPDLCLQPFFSRKEPFLRNQPTNNKSDRKAAHWRTCVKNQYIDQHE